MWDMGVKCGNLQAQGRRRGLTCAICPCRPTRAATGGAEDAAIYFHSGPPFKRVAGGEDGVAAPTKRCHARGAVHHLRYSADGLMLVSVGTNGLVCFYDGMTMECGRRVAHAHGSLSMYSCSWDCSGLHLLTCGADRCARLHYGWTGRGLGGWDLARLSSRNGGGCGETTGGVGAGVPAGSMHLWCTFVKGDVPVLTMTTTAVATLPPRTTPPCMSGVTILASMSTPCHPAPLRHPPTMIPRQPSLTRCT